VSCGSRCRTWPREFDAAIVRTSFEGGVGLDRTRESIALGNETGGRNSVAAHERVANGAGALLRERWLYCAEPMLSVCPSMVSFGSELALMIAATCLSIGSDSSSNTALPS